MDFHYTTPKGNEISSFVEMSEQELREWDDMMDGYEQWLDERCISSEEDYRDWQEQMAEDRESDGYGWERKALDKVASSL